MFPNLNSAETRSHLPGRRNRPSGILKKPHLRLGLPSTYEKLWKALIRSVIDFFSMRLFLSRSLALGVLLAVSCGLLWGQGKKRGTLNIEVVDPTGNAIPHAEVRFSPPPEDASSKLETATNGKLTLNLKPGNYTLVVACPGFKTSSTPITVRDGEEIQTVLVHMQIGYIGSVMVETTQLESPPNKCAISQLLKPTRTVTGTYTEEATRKGVEGTVVLCVTVDANGTVTNVDALSGPSELFQPSVDAAKQWQLEPPPKAPASTTIEMRYNLTKPCPDGGKGMDVGEVTVDIGTGRSIEGEQGDALKIVGKVYQPSPPYPEAARAERRRGQLYLSIVVNPDGKVVDAEIVKSLDEVLDKPALETVRTWQFKVTTGGKTTVFPVTLSFQIPCLDHR
jgi:TonB family protein